MDSFKIEQETHIAANPKTVFAELTGEISAWWDHTRSSNPKSIILEPKLNGLFYEDMGDGDGAIWGRVEQFEKDRLICWKGSMGMGSAVLCNVGIELEAKGDGTLLKLSHHAIGLLHPEAKGSYTAGWRHLLEERLKARVEG